MQARAFASKMSHKILSWEPTVYTQVEMKSKNDKSPPRRGARRAG
jgi:hypothetical protein